MGTGDVAGDEEWRGRDEDVGCVEGVDVDGGLEGMTTKLDR